MSRAAWVWALVMLAGLTALPAFAAVHESREAAYLCAVEEAPRWERTTGERVLAADGRQTLWPLGTECTLTTAADERVVLTSGWLLTAFALTSAGALLGAVVLAVLPRGRVKGTIALR